jgi:putative MATE family efflux protein
MRRKDYEFVTQGSVLASVAKLGWPVMVSYLLYTGFSIVDAVWIGRLGPDALAASGPAQFASWSLIAVGEIIGIGATALIARRVGAGERERAGRVAGQAAVLVVAAGLLALVAGGPAVRLLFRLLGTSPEVSRLGCEYLSLLCYGAVFQFAALFLESALRAAGDTRTPLFITGSGLLVNALLDPLLIFGVGPMPELGIRGAAAATVLSQAAVVAVFVIYFRSSRAAVPLDLRAARRVDPSLWWKIVSIGAPASAITVLFTVVYLFLASFLARFGTVPVAVLGVGNRLEGITFMVAHALSVATSTLVGQNLGAGRPERAASAAWLASALGMAFGTVVALAFRLIPETIFSLFTADPEVIVEGAVFLRTLAYCQTLMAVEVVMYGAFAGAGNTVPATVISVLFNALRIPAAWIISVPLGYGPVGIWWMIAISCVIRALLLAGWFRRNRWMRKEV